ncbi:uncharacterized protein BO66DRAFT_199849 [Aspergillus aculeatinus CBS 121060]|uniref:Uncharacterized protein n=1 Tax=Aspergillus aculeatinus CBS 121060 TaxID=1448322 RepID=A0ACD1GWQ7_9EURO|nr:hypothetical protein BO66DRAFT_199849 [Aspergillus aculeatinus CBS 121060]RAH65718.1 hypothetical protein BO66DRAFT_199849 [Aspergillus aculeatinus CBS 121060]
MPPIAMCEDSRITMAASLASPQRQRNSSSPTIVPRLASTDQVGQQLVAYGDNLLPVFGCPYLYFCVCSGE